MFWYSMFNIDYWKSKSTNKILELFGGNITLVILLSLITGVLCTDPVISPSSSASAVEGQNLTLTCTYPGTETVTAFAWSQDGSVEGTIRSTCRTFGNFDDDVYAYACPSNKTSTWTIRNVTQDEQGKKWRCDAVVNNVFIPSQFTTVDVAVPITSVTMTSPAYNTVSVIENTPSEEFVCEATAGRPQAKVTWYRTPASSSAGQVEITGGSTTIRNVGNLIIVTGRLSYSPPRSVDGWLIYCTASNVQSDVKTSTRKPSLNVLYAPAINYLSDVSILDGSALSKTCVVTPGNPTQTSYRWTRTKGGLTQTSATLTIARIKKGDGDTYTCTAFNTMSPTKGTQLSGSDSASFQLDVLYPPTTPIFTINSVTVSTTVSVIQGRNILVTCTSSSNPHPTYRWNTGVTAPLLTLNNIHISEDGSYACTVSNTMTPTGGKTVFGTNSSTISLHVLFPPSTPILTYGSLTGQSINTSPVKVVKGDDVKIGCSSSGDPEPYYRWSRQSGASQMLVINNIQIDTTRTCTATNTMVPTVGNGPGQRSATSTVSINVMYGPTVPSVFFSGTSSMPTTVSVIEGHTFPTVTCGGSSSKPSPSSYTWSGSVTSTSGSLSLVNVGKHQAGIFTCHVHNTMVRSHGDTTPLVGRNSKTFTLNVLYVPVVQSLSNQTIVEGNSLTKTCHVTPGIPADTSYRWTRSKGGLTQNRDTLSIANVTKSDADTYTCRAQNTMRPTVGAQQTGTDQQSFALVVLYKASITSFIEANHPGVTTITVYETDRVTFRCEVGSNPVSTIQIWNDGVKKKELESYKLDYFISQVTCHDAGLYTCTGFNSYNGDSRPSRDIQLYVRCSPRLSEGIPTNITSAQHEAAKVNVTIVAYPEPSSYVWAKFTGSTWSNLTSNSDVQISSRGLQSNLTVLDVKQADYGQYRLTVTNNVSEFQQLFYITAQDKPDAPTDFQHIPESVTETSVVIKWTPGFDGGLQQTFYIYYRPVSTTIWTIETPNYGSESMNVTLTGLNVGSTYEVQVYAINSLGNSSSGIITFSTQESTNPTENGLSAGVIGGITGSLVAVVLVILAVVLVRRYKLKIYCEFEKDDVNQDDHDAMRDTGKAETEQDAQTESVSYYNTVDVTEPPSQYTSLQFSQTTDAYDSLQNIELQETQPTKTIYENLKIN